MTRSIARADVLALQGGTPVRTRPLPPWPRFDDADAAAASAVLLGGHVNYWTGDEGTRFEREFAAWIGATHAVAVANGTVALELALHALGVGPGDEVVVPAATFIATAGAVVAVGATPVVVDVERESQCVDPEAVRAALGPRTAAVVVVHLGGWAADVDGIAAAARQHGAAVVEDCAQAHGARRAGRAVGTLGDVAAWSFCHDKILTTGGEGGAVTTGDPAVWRACWERKDHGKDHTRSTTPAGETGFRWVHDRFGTNGRLSEIQAAVGRRQLGRADEYLAARRRHARTLGEELADVSALALPSPPPDVEHAWYRYRMRLRPERLAPGWTRDAVIRAIRAEGVPCDQGGCAEIHRERAFTRAGRTAGPLPVAAELGRDLLAVPVHPTMADHDVVDVATAVRKVLDAARARPATA